MKNLFRLSALICCSLLLFGCPYESKVPISKPKFPPDNSLIGKWVEKGQNKEEYTVSIDGYEYKIEGKEIKSGNTENYKGFITEVKGVRFFNIYEKGADEISYALYKIETGNNTITLKGISEKITDKFTTSNDLKAFIEKNMGSATFYDPKEEMTFVRKN